MDAQSLDSQRRLHDERKNAATAPKAKQEKVWQFFTSAEKAAVIKGAPVKVRIGSGDESREVTIRPMNPKQLVEAWGLVADLMLPLIELFTPKDGEKVNVGLAQLVSALGPKIEKIPRLVWVILSRGNDISEEWIDNHLDMLLDLQQIIPAFINQNGLDKIFGGGGPKEAPGEELPVESKTLPPMEELAASSISSADSTGGALVMSGTI